MAVNFPPYYTSQILNADGKPVAGGLIRAYLTGTETPAPLFAPDGTPLGSSVSIDAAGNAVFCLRVGTTYRLRCIDADGAVVWTRDGVRALGETAGIENPMTGAGDMIVGAAGGEPARLAPGTEGQALKIVSGVPKWTTDETGMANPMTAAGDLIVGTTGGEPARLGVGTDGDILATASGAPTWEGGPKKYRNVYQNIPSPQIDDGYLGRLFYLSGSAQALTLPATANIPSKSFIDFVFLDDTATLTITPDGTTTLNEQATAVTIGGQAATLYRLTFLGHGGSGDEWALGGSVLPDHLVKASATDSTAAGSLNEKVLAIYPLKKELTTTGSPATEKLNIKLNTSDDVSNVGDVLTRTAGGADWMAPATQPGDHKTAVDGSDTSPGYLLDKLTDGDNAHFSKSGNAVKLDADNDKVAADNTDSAPGFLIDKLYPGEGIAIEAVNDGAVRKVKVSATGGGGGGGSYITQFAPLLGRGFCQLHLNNAPASWANFNTTFMRSVPFARKWKRIYFMYAGLPTEYATANVGLYYRDTNGDYVTDNLQSNLQVKETLHPGANTGDKIIYIDLNTEMDTTDGSRRYKLAVQFHSTTKPTSTQAFWPDNAFLRSPVTGTNAWVAQNSYYTLYANNDVAWEDVWLMMNNYWVYTNLTSTLSNIPTPSASQYQIMPWMAVE